MKCQNTLSVNAMIAVHYLSYLDFSFHFMFNEFYLILIGAIIAFLLNLVHDYSGEEEYLNSCMEYMEDKILAKVKKQLAKDYNCSVKDFENKDNIITEKYHTER